jgi:type IV secretion system protein VirB6
MADFTFLQSIFLTVDQASSTYVGTTVEGVATSIAPVAKQCFTLYVILWGFAMYRGLINEPILDGAFRLMKIGIIISLAISVGQYSTHISNNLLAAPDYLIGLLGNGGSAQDSKTVLDKILSDAMQSGQTIWEKGSLIPPGSNPGAYLMALIIWVSALVCIGYAAFLIILSKIALAVLVGIGPLFILGLMFDSTKKFFESWLGQAVNYALISGLTVAVIKLLFGMYASAAQGTFQVATTSDDFGILSICSMLIMSVVCFLVLLQVQGIASALAGGVSLSTLGAVNWAMDKSLAMGGAMRPSSVQRSLRGVQRDWRALKSGGRWSATPVTWAARKLRGSGNSIEKT